MSSYISILLSIHFHNPRMPFSTLCLLTLIYASYLKNKCVLSERSFHEPFTFPQLSRINRFLLGICTMLFLYTCLTYLFNVTYAVLVPVGALMSNSDTSSRGQQEGHPSGPLVAGASLNFDKARRDYYNELAQERTKIVFAKWWLMIQ